MPAPSALLRERPRRPVPLVSYLVTAMALLAAALGIGGIAGSFGTPASAAMLAPAADDSGFANNALRQILLPAAHTASAAVAGPLLVTVNSGQTLATIAQANCGTAEDWTGIYAASRKLHLTARNANDLATGQKLAIQCYANPGMAGRAWTPPPAPVVQAAPVQAAVSVSYSAPVQHRSTHVASSSYSGSGGMQSCIISRESGGNSQVMNSSGHYGLYQFSESTWVAHGGSASSFGHASVAEQNAVFSQTVADDGYSDWTPYDGC